MAGHEGIIVENSDKCGDDCFYLPNSSRASSANMGKYQDRLSLQANVYASKLDHLTLLLPNLKTGADFGVTSFLSGLVRMFQLGEVTSSTRRLLRGMDGGRHVHVWWLGRQHEQRHKHVCLYTWQRERQLCRLGHEMVAEQRSLNVCPWECHGTVISALQPN